MRGALVAGWLGGAGAAIAFALLALQPSDGAAATFAAVYLALVLAACCGPFLDRWSMVAFPVAAVLLCAVVAGARGGPVGSAVLGGLFAGLLAVTASALSSALGADLWRVVLCAVGLALLTTFFYWDEAFLLRAADRRASAAWAFALNPAAAASVTLGFDWMHAKALYTGNQTAESMFGVPLAGMGAYSVKLAAVLVPATLVALWRSRRAA